MSRTVDKAATKAARERHEAGKATLDFWFRGHRVEPQPRAKQAAPNAPRSRGWIERRTKQRTRALTLLKAANDERTFTIYPASKALRKMTQQANRRGA